VPEVVRPSNGRGGRKPAMNAFEEHREELEKYAQMFGKERGRLAVSLDRITNALVLVPFQLFGPNDGLSI